MSQVVREPRSILVLLDMTGDQAAVDSVIKAAKYAALPGDTVTLFWAIPPKWNTEEAELISDGGLAAPYMDSDTMGDAIKQIQSTVSQKQQSLQDLAKEFAPGAAKVLIKPGNDTFATVEATIKETKANLIIVGRRKLGQLEAIFSANSLSKHLVLKSPVAVLVVKH